MKKYKTQLNMLMVELSKRQISAERVLVIKEKTKEEQPIEEADTTKVAPPKVEAPKEKQKKTLDIRKKFKTINNVMKTDLWEEALVGGTSVFWIMILLLMKL